MWTYTCIEITLQHLLLLCATSESSRITDRGTGDGGAFLLLPVIGGVASVVVAAIVVIVVVVVLRRKRSSDIKDNTEPANERPKELHRTSSIGSTASDYSMTSHVAIDPQISSLFPSQARQSLHSVKEQSLSRSCAENLDISGDIELGSFWSSALENRNAARRQSAQITSLKGVDAALLDGHGFSHDRIRSSTALSGDGNELDSMHYTVEENAVSFAQDAVSTYSRLSRQSHQFRNTSSPTIYANVGLQEQHYHSCS